MDWDKHHNACGEAYLALEAAANAMWDEWSALCPENTRLRRIAEKLSGLDPQNINRIAMGHSRKQPPMIVGSGGPAAIFAPFGPAWSYWLPDAREALEAVEGT
jgi:hypothetical protein